MAAQPSDIFGITYDHLQSCVQLTWQYANQIPDYLQCLKVKARDFVEPKWEKMKNDLFDYTPIGEDTAVYQSLLETYLWVAICLQINSWCYFVGGAILPFFLPPAQAVVLANIGLPLLTCYWLSQPNVPEDDRRLYVLAIAILDGALMGCILSVGRLDFWSPPTACMAFSIAVSTVVYEKCLASSSRLVYIGTSLSLGLILCVLYGLLTGNLFDLRYLVWVTVLSATAYADLQFKLGRIKENATPLNASDQALSLSMFTFGVYMLIGAVSVKRVEKTDRSGED